MKTPEQIREYLFGDQLSLFTWADIDRAILYTQTQTYNQAVADCFQIISDERLDSDLILKLKV
jgi:hypothetical protein